MGNVPRGKSFVFFAHDIAIANRNNGATQVLVSISATPRNFSPGTRIHKEYAKLTPRGTFPVYSTGILKYFKPVGPV